MTVVTIDYCLLETLFFLHFHEKFTLFFFFSFLLRIHLWLFGVALLIKCWWSSGGTILQPLDNHISVNDLISSSDFSPERQTHSSGCLTGTSNSTRLKQNSHWEDFMGQNGNSVHHSAHILCLELSHMGAPNAGKWSSWMPRRKGDAAGGSTSQSPSQLPVRSMTWKNSPKG